MIFIGYLFYDANETDLVEVKSKGSELGVYSETGDFLPTIIKSYQPIPKEGKFFYELLVMVSNNDPYGANVAVGVCDKEYALNSSILGEKPVSLGYHGYGGIWSASQSFVVKCHIIDIL